ncbi:MAG: DUF1549 domain-containing protein, partial [Verrucomicrobiota bacterium]|nr:DUF1549 domain-containing protein [Verrucomicrobiota bacterium]
MRGSLQLGVFGFFGPFRATAGDHWALRPVARVEVPEHASIDPVSWFVGQRTREAGLRSAPPAARRDWLRRLYYNLSGLPPGHERLAELI